MDNKKRRPEIDNGEGKIIPPSETLRLTQQIEEARRTRDDRRRRLRKAVTDNGADGVEKVRLAAEAAVDLVWLDHAALRYCEPLGQCLIDKDVSGKLHFAMARATENAETR